MIHKKALFLIVILSLILIPIIIFALAKLTTPKIENKKASFESVLAAIEDKKNDNPIELIARKSLLDGSGEYGVVVKNLKTGQNYSYNPEKEFQSASLYKLWVMGVAFQKIKNGQISESEILTGNIDAFDQILNETTPTPTATPSGEPTPTEEKKVSYSVSDAIEKMITVSDNYAALFVASRSGSFAVTNFLKEYEFENSNFRQPPKTTASDIALFFEKIYKGEIVDENYSAKMLDILKKQTLNDRIPKYLPDDIEVAHKTGELGEYKHDAGIVYSRKGDYIIVVLSKTKNSYNAVEKIAKFSKEIFDYFSK